MRTVVLLVVVVSAVVATGCGRFGFLESGGRGNSDATADDASNARDASDATPLDAADADADADGLVAHYAMDDDPQLGTLTAIPATYSVSCGALCPTATTGRIDGGYAFSGAGRIALGHPELITSAPFTVAMWLDVTAAPGNFMTPLGKPLDLTSTLDVFSFGVLTDGTAWYESSLDGAINTISTVSSIVGAWHHMAATWDGTTRSLYLDGVLTTSAATGFDDSLLDVGLAGDLDNGNPVLPFIGNLDDLRFYSRALSAPELSALANP